MHSGIMKSKHFIILSQDREEEKCQNYHEVTSSANPTIGACVLHQSAKLFKNINIVAGHLTWGSVITVA